MKTSKDDGYYWTLWYFAALSLICTLINIWVYVDDKKLRGGVLDKIDRPGSQIEIDKSIITNSRIDDQSRDLIAEGIYNHKESGPLYEGSNKSKEIW